MRSQEPSREELVSQIADVIGQAKPTPPRRTQALSILTSFLIRTACVTYSVYLGFLFSVKFAADYADDRSSITSRDILLFAALATFFLYMVYRRVWGDRLTPAMAMVRQILPRFAKIVITFLIWNMLFNWISAWRESFMAFVATIFIIGSGYDFRLKEREPRPPSPLGS